MEVQDTANQIPTEPVKTAKQLEKEKQRLAKLEKFKQKQEKKSISSAKEKTDVTSVQMTFSINNVFK